ncbi:helix-turn-helix domain-containing protein [Streptomyces prunicolor]
MTKQPLFGQRLRELRRERGLSQAALAGEQISTGYLSRLESGARHPTEGVVSYLAGQLDLAPSAFDTPASDSPLARALSIAASSQSDEAAEQLVSALHGARNESPLLRWQALWLASRHLKRQGRTDEEQGCLEELVRVADHLGLAEFRCRSWTRYARCLLATGHTVHALETAERAYELARAEELPAHDIGTALLELTAAETEAGRLTDARAHADALVELTEGGTDALRAEALWSAATVRGRQGDHEGALHCLEKAIEGVDSRVDLFLWVRLRLAGAAVCLQTAPSRPDTARDYLGQVSVALSLVGTPLLRQERLAVEVHLAFDEGRYEDARTAYDELGAEDLRLPYRDRIALGVLGSKLLIVEGHESQGVARLRELGEQARQAFRLDLAADIWRALAETLADRRGPGRGETS